MSTVKLEHYYIQQEKLNKAHSRIDVLERRTHRLLYLAKIERKWNQHADGVKDLLISRWWDKHRWSSTWKRSAKKFRATSEGWLSLYRLVQKYLSEAREERDEARRWAIHFRGLYEQGAPMTIAGMNTRIAELEDVCREALDAAEYCTEPPFEELRQVLGVGYE